MASKIKFDSGYFHAPNKIFEVDDLKVHDKIVYLYLCRCGHNSTAFPSYNGIAKKCSISKSSAIRAVKALQDKGLLIKHTRRNSHDDRNKSNVYEVVPPSVTQTPPSVSGEHYKGTTDKQTKDIKRYLITDNEDYLFHYYNKKYKEKFGKDHPSVTEEQMKELDSNLFGVMTDLDITEDEIELCIDYHFANLPKNNDGKMFSFVAPNGGSGVIWRYLEEEDIEATL